MVVNEGNRISAFTCAEQTLSLALGIVIRAYTIIQCVVLGAKVKQRGVPTCIIQSSLQLVAITVPILDYREVRSGCQVVVVDMIMSETLAIIVAPTVKALRFHPLQVRTAHGLHVRILVIPVPGRAVVLLSFVTHVSMRTSTAVDFVIGGNPRVVRIELTVRTEVQRPKIAGTISVSAVVDNDISYNLAVLTMQRTDQQAQIRFTTPCTVEVAVLARYIARTVAIGYRRQPYKVKILAEFVGVLEQRGPTRVAVRSARSVGITIPIESLQHHIRSFLWYTRSRSPHCHAHKEHEKQ